MLQFLDTDSRCGTPSVVAHVSRLRQKNTPVQARKRLRPVVPLDEPVGPLLEIGGPFRQIRGVQSHEILDRAPLTLRRNRKSSAATISFLYEPSWSFVVAQVCDSDRSHARTSNTYSAPKHLTIGVNRPDTAGMRVRATTEQRSGRVPYRRFRLKDRDEREGATRSRNRVLEDVVLTHVFAFIVVRRAIVLADHFWK